MTDDEIYGYLALKHANGMSFRDVLKLHAHELAEVIRAYRTTPSGHPSYDDGKDAGLDRAADLIDPEVKDG